MTRLQALLFCNEMLCALYGIVDLLLKFKQVDPAILSLDDISIVSGHIGLLILEINEGRLPDFP